MILKKNLTTLVGSSLDTVKTSFVLLDQGLQLLLQKAEEDKAKMKTRAAIEYFRCSVSLIVAAEPEYQELLDSILPSTRMNIFLIFKTK